MGGRSRADADVVIGLSRTASGVGEGVRWADSRRRVVVVAGHVADRFRAVGGLTGRPCGPRALRDLELSLEPVMPTDSTTGEEEMSQQTIKQQAQGVGDGRQAAYTDLARAAGYRHRRAGVDHHWRAGRSRRRGRDARRCGSAGVDGCGGALVGRSSAVVRRDISLREASRLRGSVEGTDSSRRRADVRRTQRRSGVLGNKVAILARRGSRCRTKALLTDLGLAATGTP